MSHILNNWQPEDQAFWDKEGKKIAQRNLWISIPALFLSFAVWMVWSAVTVRLNSIGFKFTTNELFWLAAIPGLSGATLRIFYSFMVPIFGGRLWTTLSTASLAIPALWMGMAVQDVNTSYTTFVIIALLCDNVAIINNGYLGMVRQWQEFFYEKRYAATPITGPNFQKLAEAFGIPAATITKRADVAGAVESARRQKRAALIDFQVEQEDSVYPMVPAGADLDRMIRRPSPIVETAAD